MFDLFFFFDFAAGRRFIPQKIVGSPMSKVMLVTLFTKALVTTSEHGPPFAPTTKVKMRFPIPEQYGITRVPRTVPSTPPAFIFSSRQIMRNEAAMKIRTNQTGAQPVLSIHVTNDFNARAVNQLGRREPRI